MKRSHKAAIKRVREGRVLVEHCAVHLAMATTRLNERTSTVNVAAMVSTPKAHERSSVLHFLAMASKGRSRGEREEFLLGGQEEERE